MSNKKRITEEEKEQFQEAMNHIIDDSPQQSHQLIDLDDDDLPFPEVILTDLNSHDIAQYRHPTIKAQQWKKLQQGEVHWQSSLDLHGCTLQQASLLVKPHLRDCRQHNDKYTLIIHGKGLQSEQRPLLKNALATWLPSDPRILGFYSAQPKHGGTGALYVLLKQN